MFLILQAHWWLPEGSLTAGRGHWSPFPSRPPSCPVPAPFLLSAGTFEGELIQGARSCRSWSGPFKSFFNSFFLDNSAVCSGPTEASRKWWIRGEREWLGRMHNHSKTNFLAVKGSLCVCLQVSRKQMADWRKESPFVPVPRNQCGTSCCLLKQFTWQTATVNECSSCV